MSPLTVNWHWRARAEPVCPQAAVAWGDAARRLHARLRSTQARIGQLQATANRDVLVVLGPFEALPWVEGIEYAAMDERAAQLWLPTSREPDVPLDLLGEALAARFPRSPLLLWPEPAVPGSAIVVPLDRQLPVTGQWLQRVSRYWEGSHATA